MDKHDTLNQAAVVAFFAMMSLVPLLSVVLSLALGARSGVAEQIETLSGTLLPSQAFDIVHDQVHKMQADSSVGLLSLSILLLLWSASSMFVAVMDMTNAAYGVRDNRPWWKRRLLAIVLTLGESVLLIGAALSIGLWPEVMGWLRLSGLTWIFSTLVYWLVVMLALLTAFAAGVFFRTKRRAGMGVDHARLGPGRAGVGRRQPGLPLVCRPLRLQLQRDVRASAGVVLMMLWLYLAALAPSWGRSQLRIEHAAPHGKSPGQKEAPDQEKAPATN